MATWSAEERESIEKRIIDELLFKPTSYKEAADAAGVSYDWARKFINEVANLGTWNGECYKATIKYHNLMARIKLTLEELAEPEPSGDYCHTEQVSPKQVTETGRDEQFRILETWPAPTSQPQRVSTRSKEFTCLCPKTGQPDFAELILQYIPDTKVVELKSLKKYLHSFRSVGISHEEACSCIMEDLIELLDPRNIRVTLDFNTRGGFDTSVVMDYTNPELETEGLAL